MKESVFDRLYQEIGETQQRRSKLDVIKITFVSALLGFGAVKISNITTFYPVLYVAPLVAIFLDFMVMGEQFSIRRIGAFLRLTKSSAPEERDYEFFVSQNRERFFVLGARGFTVLSFVAAPALLHITKGGLEWRDWVWFAVVFVFFGTAMFWGHKQLLRLDRLTELPKRP